MDKPIAKDKEFELNIVLNGSNKVIVVKPEETTDGADYYRCTEGGKEFTQIRQEKDGSWEQIWGDLENDIVQTIGKTISEQQISTLSKP